MASITFVVPGLPSSAGTRGRAPVGPTAQKGTLKHSVHVASRRGEGADTRVTATPGQDIVVLHIENGPSLFLHPENARDLLLAQKDAAGRRSARREGSGGADEIDVPAQLQWRLVEQTSASRGGSSRSRLGDVLLRGLDVIADAARDFAADFAAGPAQSLAASLLVRRVDEQVDEAVYRLDRKALPRLKGVGDKVTKLEGADSGAALILVHGTFSNTNGTFSKLWTQHPDFVERVFQYYDNRVFALDHRTLGVSPIANALTLVRTLPQNARLHVLTHSRGGLVGEVLAHACAGDAGGLDVFKGEAYRVHRDELAELIAEARQRKVRVERLVRVACPARGTLLASKRLDAYLSVLKWSLELGGVPILPEIVDFLNGVAQYRADPMKIPGLAAQVPDNPLVRWIHEVNQPIEGDLRVVAGDLAGDSIASWLKTLLADAFYWADNDLVVQTRSMYGGTPRATKSTFVLDRGGRASHFGYFANTATASAIVNALTDDAPAKFQPIGPRSYAGEDSSGLRGRRAGGVPDEPRPGLPALILVPGIFGSHLRDSRGRVWLEWGVPSPVQRLAPKAKLGVDGLVGDFYGDLAKFLSSTHDVIGLPYDWRQPIKRSATRLADALRHALDQRGESGQPVRILSHSSGALVVRALQLIDDALWKRWLSEPEARLLMLAPPNAGLWMPMQVLTGDDSLGGLLSLGSAPFREPEARQILAELPGLVELQAGLLRDPHSLPREAWWRQLAYDDVQRVTESTTWHTDPLQRRTIEWGVPRQALLDDAVALHAQLEAQRTGALGEVAGRMLIVGGRGAAAPSGYETGADGLSYLYSEPGDGYVTHQSSALPGVRMWVADGGHMELPTASRFFAAYLELLQHGRTTQLPAPAVRGSRPEEEGTRARKRPARTPKPMLPSASNQTLLGGDMADEAAAEAGMLHVTVVNGDLSFQRQPLMLGHYRSSKLTGAEAVMNRLVGGAMLASLRKGHYPDATASRQVFINTHSAPEDPRQMPRPEAVIVVGLGEEGKLQPADVVYTVKRGVIAWAQRVSERREAPAAFELAATLIGSGGIGMTVGQSAQLIVQGVREANEALSAADGGTGEGDRPWPRVSRLQLIELYLDRATEAWRALSMTSDAEPAEYVLAETVASGQGALPRPIDSSYRGADYDFIRAATQNGPDGERIAYTLDTKRARTETRAQPVQEALLRSLIGEAADDRSQDLAIRRTLFRLLVPVDLEPFLTGDTEAQFEVDSGTAGIPWELLDDSAHEHALELPWAIRTKLLRKLRTAEFRAQVADANAEASVLVIGEPECDPKFYPPLVGAQQEARAVADALIEGGLTRDGQVVALTSLGDGTPSGPNARTVVNALLQRDWRIVHIAAHGEPPETLDEAAKRGAALGHPRGVVLSNEVFLGPREIHSMRTIPELVFVNCCYLAARDLRQLFTRERLDCESRYRNDRPKFASGVAEALIKEGVRCVIAAGWAVEDTQAMVFARTFYQHLLAGHRFIDAVAFARTAAYKLGGNTWAAYQCYGDPDWIFRPGVSDAQRPSTRSADPDAAIASARDLVLALETIAVECEFQHRPKDLARQRIARLQQRFERHWAARGAVAEAFGLAYAEAGDDPSAVEWYGRALAANDGGASVRAVEQLANLKVRVAWNAVNDAAKERSALKTKPGAKKATAVQDKLEKAIADAIPAIGAAIALLERLVEVQTSMERASLLGSAHKRMALIAAIAGDTAAEKKAIASMQERYGQAEHIGRENRIGGFYYPALNRLSAEIVLAAGTLPLDPQVVEAIRADLDAIARDNPDFWSVASQIELRLYESLAAGTLSADADRLIAAFDDLHLRVPLEAMWGSVHDQARFVLPSYEARASADEAAAARRLVDHLAGLSGRR